MIKHSFDHFLQTIIAAKQVIQLQVTILYICVQGDNMGDHLKLHEHITDISNTLTYCMIFLWFLGWILYCLYYGKCRKHTVANAIEDGNIDPN